MNKHNKKSINIIRTWKQKCMCENNQWLQMRKPYEKNTLPKCISMRLERRGFRVYRVQAQQFLACKPKYAVRLQSTKNRMQ